jgi:hypothetical protein
MKMTMNNQSATKQTEINANQTLVIKDLPVDLSKVANLGGGKPPCSCGPCSPGSGQGDITR